MRTEFARSSVVLPKATLAQLDSVATSLGRARSHVLQVLIEDMPSLEDLAERIAEDETLAKCG